MISDSDLNEEVFDESEDDDEGLYDVGASSLNYFGADFDVAGLVRRLGDDDIFVPRFDPDESTGSNIEGFQRQRVWTSPRMEKFIESLLLGWPVPSIFLVLDTDQRYLVLDGQQRLTALQSFFAGQYPDGRKFELRDVAGHLQGATYETLNKESRRKLNNTFIQATVIEPDDDEAGRNSIYRLFGRLNSGGVSLTPQEIRVALFRGKAVDLIRDLNHDPAWRQLFGAIHPRLKDHELILRALVLRDVLGGIAGKWDDREAQLSAYRPPMAETLNRYLQSNEKMSLSKSKGIEEAFKTATSGLVGAAGSQALRFAGRLNAAHVDTLIAVLMYLHIQDNFPDKKIIRQGIESLREEEEYQLYVTRSTSHRDSVYGRLKLAVETLTP